MHGLAAFLLVLGLIRHNAWELLPENLQALAWNAAGAVTMIALLLFSVFAVAGRPQRHRKKSKALYLVLGWWLYEELAVVACSGIRMVWTWSVRPGQAQCDAITQLPVSLLSVAIIAAVAIQISREAKHDEP